MQITGLVPNVASMDSYIREVSGDGPLDAQIVVVTESPSYNDKAARRPLSDHTGKLLFSQFFKAGVTRSRIRVESVCERVPPGRKFFLMDPIEQNFWREDCFDRLKKLSPTIIVPLGEEPLRLVTGKHSISKWHLSILPAVTGLGETKTVPLHSPEYIQKVFKEIPFLTFGAQRIAEEAKFSELKYVERNFTIRPTVDEAIAWMQEHQNAEWLSLDIETGFGQITCIGFSTDPKEAICIPTIPKDYDSHEFFRLWSAIGEFLSGEQKKVGQNLIYDATYLSKYGIRVRRIHHDTMVAQKFLHPELPMGLDTVARLYSREPYWKDEGKDWGVRQDVTALYYYNCKDAAVTLEAAHGQMFDLKQRGLDKLFYEKQMQYTPAIQQMCWTGLPINETKREELRKSLSETIVRYGTDIQSVAQEKLQKDINPRSNQQVKELLKACGYKLPLWQGKESSDKEALLKLRLKDPESQILTPLLKLSEANKRLSSYVNYQTGTDRRLRFSLYNHKTESGRWAGGLDPWDQGINVQTIPGELKGQFEAPAGRMLCEVDLRQAESRFVAWDGPVPKLIEMFRAGEDIHRFVASHPLMFCKPIDQVTKQERQLGKKSGHAANYDVGAATLSDSCLKEMDFVLPVSRAQAMLDGYHAIFDGAVRRWQKKIAEEVTRTKRLRTPAGYERYFYDRIGPDLFREAYAYRPQNVVCFTINELLLWLFGKTDIVCLAQIHDSLLLEFPEENRKLVESLIRDQDAWNPTYTLSGGDLRIPIEIKMGKNWREMELVYEG